MRKRYCKICHQKLKRGEKEICPVCHLKQLGQKSFDIEKIKKKIWDEIVEQVEENKLNEKQN